MLFSFVIDGYSLLENSPTQINSFYVEWVEEFYRKSIKSL